MNYAEIKPFDVANSPYVGSTLFVSGCNFNCCGCFNKEAQNFNYGKEFTEDVEDYFIECLKHEQVKNANLLGGEITQQNSTIILQLVKRIKLETNCNIWMWTGDLYDNLIKKEDWHKVLQYVDIIIDGRFDHNKKHLNLKYRGSLNQRIINCKESLKRNEVIEFEF